MSATAPPAGPTSTTELKREFTLWSSFAFAFAFISPIVALYGIFALAITTAGPAFWWAFPLVFAGQLLVALVFAVLVSRWPLEGSIYQWSRGLLGTGYGWFAGWAYLWTLVIAMTTVALGAAGFLAAIVGMSAPSGGQRALIALGILVAGTLLNLVGRVALKVFLTASIAAEVLGSVVLGAWLLLFHREQPLSVLWQGVASGDGGGAGYLSLSGPFLVAVAFVGFSFVGFESAGSIAEEVRDPRRAVPRAVIASLTLIAVVVMFSAAAIILAIPDLGAVLSGDDADPVSSTLTAQLGAGIATPVELLFVIGFLASFLALQTSASRVVWAYARDRALPGGRVLARLSPGTAQPTTALLLVSGVGAALLLLSLVAGDVYTLMINFTTGGFSVAFLFPLVGFVVVQLRRGWTPGPFTLGRATLPVSVVAAVWALFQLFNIAWPRPVNEQRWLDWSVWIAVAVLAVVGAAVYASVRRGIVPVATPDEEATTVAHEGSRP
ncbi:amino acid/polyamine/organocation transporter, APC superfamily [Quadrisphaera granulorum]|uniref:Amino acid/polyamine/organocation transporter (APC superfamily) n=1 Tax=Quadrisphaera granulorum TaxID=317664 RepID=A0A315ZUP9_9ACTN|nr:amino acid permease [Quadrisphaera granulorum]PWJ48670.1 amino acid/polyamine/organocation transporter (APC superfamily) [Quadrisphaera granulorum]SZE98392.1 amino acid/polyamine/organocation transporter, APC superfamily [Quadrisphaera granulorum]